jgi:hypothetical protein
LLPRRLVVTLRSNVSLFYFDASPSVSSLAEFSGVPHQGRTTFILRAVAFIILLSIFIYLFIFYQSTPPHFFILKQLKRLQMYLGFFFSNHSNSSKRKPVNVRVTKKKKKIKLPSDFRGKAPPLSSPVHLSLIRNGHSVIVGSQSKCISSAAWRQYRIAPPRPARLRLRPHPCRTY